MRTLLALLHKEVTVRRRSFSVVLQQFATPLFSFIALYIALRQVGNESTPTVARNRTGTIHFQQTSDISIPTLVVYIYSRDDRLNKFILQPMENISYETSACSNMQEHIPRTLTGNIQFRIAEDEEALIERLLAATTESNFRYFTKLHGRDLEQKQYTIGAVFRTKHGGHIVQTLESNNTIHIEYRIEQMPNEERGRPTHHEQVFRAHKAILSRLYQYRQEQFKNSSTSAAITSTLNQTFPGLPRGSIELPIVKTFTFIIGFSFLFTLSVLSERLYTEKSSKMLLLMKISKISSLKYYASFFIVDFTTHFLLCIFFIAMFVPTDEIVDHLIIMTLFCSAIVLFTTAFTLFFNSSTLGIIAYSFVTTFMILTGRILAKERVRPSRSFNGPVLIPDWAHLFLCVFSHPLYALDMGFTLVEETRTFTVFYEDSVSSPHLHMIVDRDLLTIPAVIASLVASNFFWMFVILYIGEILPSPDFSPKPFYFPLLNLMPKLSRKTESIAADHGPTEPVSETVKQGIEVTGVRQRYAVNRDVLRSISLQLFYGQTTAILGHNSAGKTTLLKVMGGVLEPNFGRVLIDGEDIHNSTNLRKIIGFCPQTNVLHDNLTVYEHLHLFGVLKKCPKRDLNLDITNLLQTLHLLKKQHIQIKNLSDGAKRRVQVGMAFVGKSRIVLLDEPSSGMDIESRKRFWHLLRSPKGESDEHIIAFTTYHMEEASALGDRVALMHHGKIRCCGSMPFLKNTFGVGYFIRISKGQTFNNERCLKFLKKHLATVSLVVDGEHEAVYTFSKSEMRKLGALLDSVETAKSDLGIVNCGVKITSDDEIYVKAQKLPAASPPAHVSPLIQFHDRSESSFRQRFRALFLKRWWEAKRSWLVRILLACTFFGTLMVVFMVNYNPVHRITAGVQQHFSYTKRALATCRENSNDSVCTILEQANLGANISFSNVTSVETILTFDMSKKGEKNYCMTLVTDYPLDVSALTMAYNGIFVLLDNSTGKITAELIPTQRMAHDGGFFGSFMLSTLATIWGCIILVPPLRHMMLEKLSEMKMLQMMTGLSPFSYWFPNFCFDFCLISVISFPVTVLPLILFFGFEFKVLYGTFESLVVFYYRYVLVTAYAILFAYVATFFCSSVDQSLFFVVLQSLSFAFAGTSGPKMADLVVRKLSLPTITSYVARVFFWLTSSSSPSFQAGTFFSTLNVHYYNQTFCEDAIIVDRRACDQRGYGHYEGTFQEACCRKEANTLLKAHFTTDTITILTIMVPVWALAWILLLAFFEKASKLLRSSKRSTSLGKRTEDGDVAEERRKTEDIISQDKQKNYGLVVQNLTKCRKNVTTVDHLTFYVEQKQCFGLLGITGSGKTAALRILIGETPLSRGEAYIGHLSLGKHYDLFKSQIGYCPQNDSFLPSLNAREILTLFANLRHVYNVAEAVDHMLHLVGLDTLANHIVDTFSANNKRRLSIAIALIGFPTLIVLDEPTTSVDPITRRKIWELLTAVHHQTDSSLLLTSNSIDECELLCEKIVVLMKGKMKCCGPVQYLKQKFGRGYTINITMKSAGTSVESIKKAVAKYLSNTTFDVAHGLTLQLQIVEDPKVKQGHIYDAMEKIVRETDIEDYEVTESSLEQMFLSFPKKFDLTEDDYFSE